MENQELINMLYNCAATCEHCAGACLDEKDVTMLTQCIKHDLDCAEICKTTASLLARGSEHAQHIMPECAEICTVCAEECEKHSHMEHCRICADTCRQCAEMCHSGMAA
jgi:hypothetical protein